MTAVVAEGLTKSFGKTKALCGIDLEIERAKVLGVLGPNGAGKTTAVRVLTTLLKPDTGRAYIDGIDVLREPRRARARIGLTGQYAAVDERLTGFENLEHVGRLFHMPTSVAKSRARELLERFGLEGAADRVVKGYSGGMRRRLDIAMSLIGRPSVLFLDEPTTGLDPRSRIEVWDLIDELVRGGTTTLLTTQYLDEADRLADQIAVIDHGVVIARGTADELKTQAGGDQVEIQLADFDDADRVVNLFVDMSCGNAHFDDKQKMVIVPVPDIQGLVPQVVRQLDEANIVIKDVGAHRSTLDDVFFSLTGHGAENGNGNGSGDGSGSRDGQVPEDRMADEPATDADQEAEAQ